MYEQLVPKVLKQYGVTYEAILPAQKGYRNEIYPIRTRQDMIQLTFYKREAGIVERMERADAVSKHAADWFLPTRQRIDERTIHLKGTTRDVYAGLYNYLPGSTIAWEAYTKNHIKLLGQTMSNLHGALLDYEGPSPLVIDECEELLDRMMRYFTDPQVVAAIDAKLGLEVASLSIFKKLLTKSRELPTQQLHMDFVRGNILFSETTCTDTLSIDDVSVTGILDFEKTAVGHPLFDVARTLAFLLVDCKYKTEDQIMRYFLQSGYTKRGSQSLDYYPQLLEKLIQFFLLHDFYKFLRHTPYEALEQNEHYVRTRYVLVNRGMVHYI